MRDAVEWDVFVVHVPFSGNSSPPSSGPCSWRIGRDGARKKMDLDLRLTAAVLVGVGSFMNWCVKQGHTLGFNCSWKGLEDN